MSRNSMVVRFVPALALAAAFLAAPSAFAGEIKFGKEPLAVDAEGKLTDAGAKAAVEEVPSVPGDEEWIVHLWARLDKSGPGALNIEFYGKTPDGQKYLAYRHVENDFEGGKYVSLELELEDGQGFNKNHSYTVEITQLDDKNRDVKLATGKLKLGWTPPPAEGSDEGKDEEGKEDEGEGDDAAQDAQDTLGTEAPPPVESGKKKGCAIERGSDAGALGGLVLVALAGLGRRRRVTRS